MVYLKYKNLLFKLEVINLKKKVNHDLKPYYNKDSKILILGSMPSVKSKELGFYYMHPQNRFWKTLAKVYDENIPLTISDKKEFLKKHKIALWDTIKSCTINNSSDSSISNVVPNDINYILSKTNIDKIFTTGKKSYNLYYKYCFKNTKISAEYLPSTSPANCPKNIEEILYKEYSKIKDS